MSFAAPLRIQRLSRSFYVWVSIGAIALLFAGFARTYYLHALFGQPALSVLLRIHGAVMSSWFVLFALQSGLIATGHQRFHRTLGWAGVGLGVVIVVLGTFVAVHAAIRDLPHPELGSIFFLGADGSMLALFSGFFAAAAMLRKRSDLHKRLVLLATLCILPAAIGRLPGLHSVDRVVLATSLVAAVLVATDTWRCCRLHPILGWGAPLALASLYLAFKAAQSQAWTNFAMRLLSL